AGLLESELFGHAKGAFTGAAQERAGRFEAADGGTIFLDEIDSAPLELQVKLLRFVQDRAFERVGETRTRTADVRIVAATNADLASRVIAGSFREDLLWRLRVVEVDLPPLRDRPRDLAPLASAFVDRFADEYAKPLRGITPAALGVLAAVPWPGNVRQLEHAIERAVLLSRSEPGPGAARRSLDIGDLGTQLIEEAAASAPAGTTVHLPLGIEWLADLTRVVPLKEALEGPEKLLIERALARHGGRRDRAAEDLEINRSTLFNKMRKYGLLDVNFADEGA
ncbi:MAG: sigma 54-interacting transcriptional regulator, partial [Planctomycetota bacterium]